MTKAIATVAATETTLAQRNEWKNFHRFGGRTNFFGVVNKEGEWVDSSIGMNAAISHAAMDAGIPNEYENQGELIQELQKYGYSIIHDSILERMFYAGLLK